MIGSYAKNQFPPTIGHDQGVGRIYQQQLQNDLDEWIDHYNNERTHQGKICEGKTPMQTLEDGKRIWKEKFIDQT